MAEFRERLLSRALPAFYEELEQLLRAEGHSELVKELSALILQGRCGCGDDSCSSIDVRGGQRLAVQENREGERRIRETVDLEAPEGMIIIDVENLSRIRHIEILNRDDVDHQLTAIGLPRKSH